MTPRNYVETHQQEFLAELMTFARIPSVSTDPAYATAMQRAAQWVAGQLANVGLVNVRLMPTERHPVVYGEWLQAPGAPTILIYGHYDVQPPDPLDKWLSPPFEPEIRDDRLYGRGVSDDKGPLFVAIKAAQAFFATTGKLPVNVKFMIEGEEEIGSPSLETFIRDQAALLAADFVLSADGAMWRIDEPSITISSRGMTGLELTLRGPGKDLHSGRHGGAVANPLHALAELIASLHTADGRVMVAGFYDTVVDVPPLERQAITSLPFDEAAYARAVGAAELVGEPGYAPLERQWIRPTLEVNGMWGGYQGPGSKSVIPSEAHAKITCRLVPDQSPDDIRDKVIQHLQTHRPPGVTLTIEADAHGARPYRIPANHLGLTIAARALQAVYQKPPVFVRMGGTLPVAELFKRDLDLETVFFSFSTADEDFHAPNEFFRVHRLFEGIQAWMRYWELLADQ